MRIVRFSTFEELTQYSQQWDRICGTVPFRSWDWASTWWQYYGRHWHSSRELFVLGVFDDSDNLVGLAPWYVERSVGLGRVVRFLGTGEVCSDYLDILGQPGLEKEVAAALADWMDEEMADYCDLIELTVLDSQDSIVGALVEKLDKDAFTIHSRPGDNCWQIALPSNFEEYVAGLSKNNRKSLRKAKRRMLDSGRAVLRSAQTAPELAESMEILIDLHKRRFMIDGRQTSNTTDRFWNFHRDIAQRMLRGGRVWLHTLDIDGIPAAAEYEFSSGGILYTYQSGIDTDRLDISPGRVMMAALIRWAIEQGYHGFDLMRGDEAYKADWGAEPRGCSKFRIVPGRMAPWLRHAVWLAGSNTYHWLKGET